MNIEKDSSYKDSLVEYFVEYGAPVAPESSFHTNLELSIFCRSHDLTTFQQERVKSGGELPKSRVLEL